MSFHMCVDNDTDEGTNHHIGVIEGESYEKLS